MLLGGQTFAWIQAYGPLLWPKLKSNMWFAYCLAPLIAFFYIYGTKFMVEAFDGTTWPTRVITFCIGIAVFAIATGVFAKEGINMKTTVSLILCVTIVLIQVFWKTT